MIRGVFPRCEPESALKIFCCSRKRMAQSPRTKAAAGGTHADSDAEGEGDRAAMKNVMAVGTESLAVQPIPNQMKYRGKQNEAMGAQILGGGTKGPFDLCIQQPGRWRRGGGENNHLLLTPLHDMG